MSETQKDHWTLHVCTATNSPYMCGCGWDDWDEDCVSREVEVVPASRLQEAEAERDELRRRLACHDAATAAVERAGIAIGTLLRERGDEVTMRELAVAALTAAREAPVTEGSEAASRPSLEGSER